MTKTATVKSSKSKDGKAVEFAKGLNDPKGLIAHQKNLFVTDKNRVMKIDDKGSVTELVSTSAFPKPPVFLNDIVADEQGNLYITDSGDRKGDGGAIFKYNQKEKKVSLVLDKAKFPALHSPNGIAMDGLSFVLLGDMGTETLYRVKIEDGSVEKLADGLGRIDGICWDNVGTVVLECAFSGQVHVIPRPGMKAEVIAEVFRPRRINAWTRRAQNCSSRHESRHRDGGRDQSPELTSQRKAADRDECSGVSEHQVDRLGSGGKRQADAAASDCVDARQ